MVSRLGISLLALLTLSPLPALGAATLTQAPEGAVLMAQQDSGAGEADSDEAAEGSPYPENFVFPRIPVTFPPSAEAPGLTEFVASLRSTAEKRDDAALVASVAPKIFWDRDFGGGFVEAASGVENFRQALQIGIADILPEYADDGWKRLIGILVAGRFSTEADHPGAYCTPVFPTLADEAAADKTFATVDMADGEWQLYWAYAAGRAEVRDAAKADAKVIGSLEDEAVPVHAWGFDETAGWVEIGMPDGRHGFAEERLIGSWIGERLCPGQVDGKWSIVGYVGGGD